MRAAAAAEWHWRPRVLRAPSRGTTVSTSARRLYAARKREEGRDAETSKLGPLDQQHSPSGVPSNLHWCTTFARSFCK
uniref:Uncharacterized protein n=1 Tax=Leersia perrieri TaxID=77586 RepID=A0A0D9X7R5_9ORYZ